MIWERRRISRAWLSLLFIAVPVALVLMGNLHLQTEPGAPRPLSLAAVLTICTTVLAAAYFPITLTPLHPIAAAGYRGFLQSVSWGPGDPLLRGPAHPVWMDFLVAVALVGAAALLASPWHAAVVWLVSWVFFAVTAASLMLGCRVWSGFALLVAAIAAGLAPVIENGVWEGGGIYSLAVSVAATGPLIFWGRRGILRSLRGFPWDHERKETTLTWAAKVGSPYDRLAPLEIGEPIGLAGGAGIGAVVAAIVMGLFLIPTRDPEIELLLVILTVGICIAMPLVRWTTYAVCHRRPFGFRKTRAVRGRLFIPEYDQIFVPTLGALAASILVMIILRAIGAPWFVAAPAAILANFTVLLGCGPSDTVWSLTGGHNISLRGKPPGTTPQPRVRITHHTRL